MKNKSCRLMREDVTGGGVQDKIIFCSWEDMNVVLTDWETIMKNYKKVSVDICLNYFSEHPSYKNLFPSFMDVPEEDLPGNEDFRVHSYAILRGIDSLMSNWSGKYEEENKIMRVISKTHVERGITKDMMLHLKDSLLFICCNYLKTTRKQKASWEMVVNHIFDEYVCSGYPKACSSPEIEEAIS